MMKKSVLWGVSLVLWTSISGMAHAGAQQNFCQFDAHLTGNKEITQPIGWTTLALQQLNGTLAILSSLNMHYRITKLKDSTHTLKKTLEIFKIWKQTKLFVSTIIPPLDRMEKVFDQASNFGPVKKLRQEPLDLTRTQVRRLYSAMLLISGSVALFKVSALAVCGKTKLLVQVCVRNNKSCAATTQDMPSYTPMYHNPGMMVYPTHEAGPCALDDATKISRFIALDGKYSSTLASANNVWNSFSQVLWTYGPSLKKVGEGLQTINSYANQIGNILNSVETVMQPLYAVSNQLDRVLDEQICVKVKVAGIKVKKCSRLRNLLEEVEKLGAFAKPFEEEMEKLINPLFNQLKKAIPDISFPGLDQIDNLLTGATTELNNFEQKMASFLGNPFASHATIIQQIDTELGALQ